MKNGSLMRNGIKIIVYILCVFFKAASNSKIKLVLEGLKESFLIEQ